MARGLRRAGLVALAAAAPACSLLVDTSGLSQGEEPAGDAVAEARSDGALAETGSDGGGDVEVVDGGPFCARQDASFCDDFDDAALGLSQWTPRTDRGTVSTTSAAAPPSPPYVLAVRTTGNGDAHVYLQADLANVSGRTTLAHALRLEGDHMGGRSIVTEIATTLAGVTHVVGLIIVDGRPALFEGLYLADGGVEESESAPGPPLGSGWVHAVLVADRGPTRSMSVSIDGTIVDARAMNAGAAGGGQLRLRLGLNHENVPITAYFDNVVVTP